MASATSDKTIVLNLLFASELFALNNSNQSGVYGASWESGLVHQQKHIQRVTNLRRWFEAQSQNRREIPCLPAKLFEDEGMFSAMLDNGIDFRYKSVCFFDPQPNCAALGPSCEEEFTRRGEFLTRCQGDNFRMAQNPPTDMPRITPHIFYDDVAAATDWLVNAFGFEVRLRMTDKSGGVVHTELEVADSLVMLGLTAENSDWISPQTVEGRVISRLYIFIDNIDAHYERAVAHGAKIIRPPADQFWGDRVYECIDPEGHRWKFAQHLWDVDNRNLKRPEDRS